MLSLKDFFEISNYNVTESTSYLWSCFGPNAQSMDYWNGDHDGHSVCVIFDRKTQVVYMMEVCDYKNDRAYRIINPDYVNAYKDEVKFRNIDDVAYDDTPWIDLEIDEDFLNKAKAIVEGRTYDTRVTVPIHLDDDELFELMKRAHQLDITLNQLIERALQAAIDQHLEEKPAV